MQRRRTFGPGKECNKLFENVLCKERIHNFFQGWKGFFPAELLRGKSRNKNSSRGVRGTIPRKFFENLDSVIAILVLFVQFLRKMLFKFFTPNFESFTKYDAFRSHISVYAC